MALVSTFQIFTGENWQFIMYDGARSNGLGSVVIYVILFLIGRYVLLNMYATRPTPRGGALRVGPKANPSPETPALALAPAVTRARARALAVALGRYLAIILACFATEHEESKQTAQRQAEKKKTMRADLSAAYKRASAKWKSSKLCVIEAERRGSAPSVLGDSSSRLSGVAMEAAAAAGVGLTPRLMRRKSSSRSGLGGSANSLSEASATLKEDSTGKKRRKSTERPASPPPRPRPPPKPEPEEMMSEDQAALALQNSWRRHEARISATAVASSKRSSASDLRVEMASSVKPLVASYLFFSISPASPTNFFTFTSPNASTTLSQVADAVLPASFLPASYVSFACSATDFVLDATSCAATADACSNACFTGVPSSSFFKFVINN